MERNRRARPFRIAIAAAAAVVIFAPTRGVRAEGAASAPLAGVARLGTVPVPGIELLVHGLSAPIASFSRIVRTAADGTWVLPDVPAGLYAISSLAPGFRPAVARVWHRVDRADVSFVTLPLERSGGVLPPTARGVADPWLARATTPGDVLRDEEPSAVDTASRGPALPTASSQVAAADLRSLPLSATVASTAGFGASDGANVSGTSLDVSGNLGPALRWGLVGQYRRLGGGEDGVAIGNASRMTLDVAPGDQSIRLSARRQSLSPDGADTARFAAQAIDWSGATGDRSRASVSAQLVSESNLLQHGPAADLFAHASNAFEVEARYRTETEEGNFVRFAVGYRSATGVEAPSGILAAFDRETHLGGVAGIQVTHGLSLEAGATGDVSNLVRGVAPELTLAVRTPGGIRIWGFVSRRFERRLDDELPLARAGVDVAGLARLSRSLYQAGVRWTGPEGEGVSLEASQRELLGTYRLLLDPEFFDTLDSLYFLEGDVAREVSASGSFLIAAGLQGRLTARAGWTSGERAALISRDQARYAVAEAAVRIGVTRTSLGVGYRSVSQELDRSARLLKNDLSSVNFSLAQALPLPLLDALGTEWRALFSLEIGKRQEGEQEARLNRRFSGGLALGF